MDWRARGSRLLVLPATDIETDLERRLSLLEDSTFAKVVVLGEIDLSKRVMLEAYIERHGRVDLRLRTDPTMLAEEKPLLHQQAPEIVYMPPFAEFPRSYLRTVEQEFGCRMILPLTRRLNVSLSEFSAQNIDEAGWIAPFDEGIRALRRVQTNGRLTFTSALASLSAERGPVWGATQLVGLSPTRSLVQVEHRRSTPSENDLTVLAVVPHYKCENWLETCLLSLTKQSRALDAIVVVDDASENPPVDIVAQFPQVTMIAADKRTGPEQLLHGTMALTDYDAYMLQDADDWASFDRLESLIATRTASQANVAGSFAVNWDTLQSVTDLMTFPVNVSAAAEQGEDYNLLHGTSLIDRDFASKIGGFDPRYKLEGDSEFMSRAALLGNIVNCPMASYYRRVRQGSLTTSPLSGFSSTRRLRETSIRLLRAEENHRRMMSGRSLRTRVPGLKSSVGFRHIAGPSLRSSVLRDVRG